MSSSLTYDEVFRMAQSLNQEDRARLVEELLSSLSLTDAALLDDVWLAELDRRSNELDSGAAQTIPWAEVRRRAKERTSRRG